LKGLFENFRDFYQLFRQKIKGFTNKAQEFLDGGQAKTENPEKKAACKRKVAKRARNGADTDIYSHLPSSDGHSEIEENEKTEKAEQTVTNESKDTAFDFQAQGFENVIAYSEKQPSRKGAEGGYQL